MAEAKAAALSGAASLLALAGFRPNRFLNAPPPAPTVAALVVRVAAIYARFSTERQRMDSLERQFAACRPYANGLEAEVVLEVGDAGETGVSMHRRGLRRLLAEAELRRFNVLIVESLDRLSRDAVDLRRMCRRFLRLGIEVHQVSGGKLDLLTLALSADIADDDREIALARARQGARRALAEGRVLGRCAFGYARDRRLPGVHVPHPERAAIVRSIFERVDRGETAAEVAATLTCMTPGDCLQADGDKVPTGAFWTASMVQNILRQPLYKGILTGGKTKVVRDAESYKMLRQAKVSPDLWDVFLIPELALVDAALWDRVQPIVATAAFGKGARRGQRVKLLSGRLQCGLCGSKLTNVNGTERRYFAFVCPSPDCAGIGRPMIETTERAVLAFLAHWLEEVAATRLKAQRREPDADQALRRELLALERELQQALAAAPTLSAPSAASLARRRALEQRTAAIRVVLDPARDAINPVDADDLRTRVLAALASKPGTELEIEHAALVADVRRLLHWLVMRPEGSGRSIDVEIDPSVLGGDLGLAVVRTIETDALTLEDRNTILARRAEVHADRLATLAESPLVRLPADLRTHLERLSASLTVALTKIGWSLPSLIEAVIFRRRGGCALSDLPSGFGPAEGYEAAMAVVRQSGERGRIARVLSQAEEHFTRAVAILFPSRVAPLIEFAMTAEAVSALRRAAREADPDSSRRLNALAEWLHASRLLGRPSRMHYDDRSLTRTIVSLSRQGLEALVLTDGCEAIRAADADVKAHLSGESCHAIAKRLGLDRNTVISHVTAFRADGGSLSPRCRWRTLRRLSDAQIKKMHDWVEGGVDPDHPEDPINTAVLSRLCLERFGCVMTPRTLNEFVRHRIGLRPTHNLPSSSRTKAADLFRNMAFED